MKKAIIDIGSNTINLLIGEIDETGKLHIYHDEKNHAKLARGGINEKTILPDAFARGINCIEHYAHLCTLHMINTKSIQAFATATVRNTNNGMEFTHTIFERFGIHTEIISGDREASLIFNGIKYGIPKIDGYFLVLDIGGGSTEFIIANEQGIVWKQSFELGVSKLLDLLTPGDPVTPKDIENINQHLNQKLSDFDDAIQQWSVKTLVGSSGSFDTLKSITQAKKGEKPSKESYYLLNKNELNYLFSTLIAKTTQQRLDIKGIDPMRAEYMPIAALLIKLVLEKTGIQTIYQCAYALKEGAFFEKTIHNNNELKSLA